MRSGEAEKVKVRSAGKLETDTGPGSGNETGVGGRSLCQEGGGGDWETCRGGEWEKPGVRSRPLEPGRGRSLGRRRRCGKYPAPGPHLTTGSFEKQLDQRSVFTGRRPLPEGPSVPQGRRASTPRQGPTSQWRCGERSHWDRGLLPQGGPLKCTSAYQTLYPSPTSRVTMAVTPPSPGAPWFPP